MTSQGLEQRGWARPPRARQYHFFPGSGRSACGRWSASWRRDRLFFVPPRDKRCSRCDIAVAGALPAAVPQSRRSREDQVRELTGELAVATAREIVRGRHGGEQLTVSVALLRRLLKVADDAAAERASAGGNTANQERGGGGPVERERLEQSPTVGARTASSRRAAGGVRRELDPTGERA